jgi:hypothetical protein
MQRLKLKTLLVALSLGAVAGAGAQTYGPATGDTSGNSPGTPATMPLNSPSMAPPPADTTVVAPSTDTVIVPSTEETTVIVAPSVPPTGLDAKADAKCRGAGVNSYWECVNSYNAGQ